ncbi:GAD-like domain-containing protein [Agaribacterium sp. ZY112]|uniref:GAD-like domain-containing protein n=1 Tax=Agaribacterium sp. ZY112 TaxID=3233574 RepID=UPI0035247F20
MNKYIDSFFDEFEAVENQVFPDQQTIKEYSAKLPENLISFWGSYGFCSFLSGLFWIVNPKQYKGELCEWLDKAGLEGADNYHVIAKSAFGDLFVWKEDYGLIYEINSMNSWIILQDPPSSDLNKEFNLFLASLSPDILDVEDESTGEEMHEQLCEKLGPTSEFEVYSFTPSLVAGGGQNLNSLNKSDLFLYLSLIKDLKSPSVITEDDLSNMAFS